jgi:hypothetical protein
MMDEIHIQEIIGPTAGESEVEIVERKGLGHPDTICDLVMEQISQQLSRVYTASFGRILHHNCDKGLLVAGQVERSFGGGRVIEPMKLVIGDRATLVKEFDVAKIAVETANRWFHRNFPDIEISRDLVYQVELKGGSDELTDIFRPGTGVAQANDTSAAVGYAPLSETERLVLDAERLVFSPAAILVCVPGRTPRSEYAPPPGFGPICHRHRHPRENDHPISAYPGCRARAPSPCPRSPGRFPRREICRRFVASDAGGWRERGSSAGS